MKPQLLTLTIITDEAAGNSAQFIGKLNVSILLIFPVKYEVYPRGILLNAKTPLTFRLILDTQVSSRNLTLTLSTNPNPEP